MADHTYQTTAGINRRSSIVQINDAIKECTKSALKEYKATGLIGNTRPDNVEHAFEIAYGLSAEDARRRAGSIVPVFPWNQERWPEVYRKQHKLPYHFLPDIHMKPKIEKAEDQAVFNIGNPAELLQEVLDEVAEEQGEAGPGETDPDIAELERILAEAEGQAKPGSGPDEELPGGLVMAKPSSSSENIRQGLRDRKMYGPPPPENLAELHRQALEEKAPEDLTSGEKIRLGAAEAEWIKGKNPARGE